MKRLAITAASALLALAGGSAAQAADLAVKAAPVALEAPSWTGPYFGGSIGYMDPHGSGSIDYLIPPPPKKKWPVDPLYGFSGSNSDFIGGVQAGYNYQLTPQWVVGIEGNFDFMGSGGSTFITPEGVASLSQRTEWLASLRGRGGYVYPIFGYQVLWYGTGGVAWGDIHSSLTDIGQSASFDTIKTGWVAGGGAEGMLSRNWSARVEYLHYDLGSVSGSVNSASFTRKLEYETIMVGVNYRL